MPDLATHAASKSPTASAPLAVRPAVREEMDDLLALMREAEAEQQLFPLSLDKARAMLNRAFDRQGGIVPVIGPRGAIEAACYVLIDQPIYSDIWVLTEVFNFVRPAFRRSSRAKDLIAAAKSWALELSRSSGEQIPLVMGVISNKRTAEKIRLYRRQLGTPVGAFFVFNTAWPGGTAADDRRVMRAIVGEEKS